MEILTFCDYYLPGYRAGGLLRTLVNMVERLGDEFRFKIVTSDRDLREPRPYADVRLDDWQPVGKATVCYLSSRGKSLCALAGLLRGTPHDAVYLNSVFSPTMTLKPLLLRRTGRIPRRPVLLAPRGELAREAVSLKGARKRAWLAAARAFGFYDGITWQAAGEHERADILRFFQHASRVAIAPDVPAVLEPPTSAPPRTKRAGSLSLVFLGRIARVKNLHGALELLDGVPGEVRFDIYGPTDDSAYGQECERIAARLGSNVRVEWRGAVPPGEVPRVLGEHDLLFLPSLGESFGHVILEALQVGCPVLISDRTPWRALEEKGIGWDLPLEDGDRFRGVLRACVGMDEESFRPLSLRARAFGTRCAGDAEVIERNRALLASLCEERGSAGGGRA